MKAIRDGTILVHLSALVLQRPARRRKTAHFWPTVWPTHHAHGPDNHEAQDYAERLRERLPKRLQEMREAAGLSKFALARKADVSRDRLGCVQSGESIQTLHVTARLIYENFFRQLRRVRGASFSNDRIRPRTA